MPRHLDPNHQYYVDSAPTVDGKAYFGQPNQDPTILANQIIIYSTRSLTPGTEILQPVPTGQQGRVNVAVYMAESEYSYQVFDSLNNLLLDEALLEPLNVSGLVQANIDMDGFKHINVGDATANNQYASLGQSNKAYPQALRVAGASSPNAIVVNLPIAPDALEDGQQFRAILDHGANTGNFTVKLNSFPAKAAYVDDNDAPAAGITRGSEYVCDFVYNGTLDKIALLASALVIDPSTQIPDRSIAAVKVVLNSLTRDEIATNAIHQDELSATPTEISKIAGAASFFNLDIGGADYMMLPSLDLLPNGGAVAGIQAVIWDQTFITNIDPAGFGRRIQFQATSPTVGVNPGVTIRELTVDNSPPWNIGDGEIPLFVYAEITPEGDIASIWSGENPPWDQLSYEEKFLKDKLTEKELRKQWGISKKDLGRKYRLNRKIIDLSNADFEDEIVEITPELKNKRMVKKPQPFLLNSGKDHQGKDVDSSRNTIVMLDPCESSRLLELRQAGFSINDMIIKGELKITNDFMANRKSPHEDVKIIPIKWK